MPTLSGNSVSNGVSAETAILNNLQATTSRPKKNSIPLHSKNLYHTRQQLFSVIRGTHFSHCYTGICWEQITPSILVSSLLLNNEQPLLCWINRKSFTEINTGRSNNWEKNIFWWKYFTFNLISIQIYNRWWSMPAIFGMPSISGDWWDSNWVPVG